MKIKTKKKECKNRCGNCVAFITDSAQLERELPGLNILSSTDGDTMGNQGICAIHKQFLTPHFYCNHFSARD